MPIPAWEDAILVVGDDDRLGRITASLQETMGAGALQQYDSLSLARGNARWAPLGVIVISASDSDTAAALAASSHPLIGVTGGTLGGVPPAVTDTLRATDDAETIDRRLRVALALGLFRQSIQGTTVSRLECALRAEPPLGSVARVAGGAVDVLAVVPTAAESVTCYVEGPTTPVKHLVEIETVRTVTVVSRRSQGSVYALTGPRPPVVDIVTEFSGRVLTVQWLDDRTHLTIEIATPALVRPLVDGLEAEFGSIDITAHRRVTAEGHEARLYPAPLRSLTVQELATLEAAYHGGYFEWPRSQTGQEIAESLGVAQSTFARHLRRALAEILGSLLPAPGMEE